MLQFCVQGTFTPENYDRGQVDTRWQSLHQLTEGCSKEDFERLYKQHLKDLEKTFKRAMQSASRPLHSLRVSERAFNYQI